MLNYYAYAIGGVVLIMFLWALIGTILAFKCVAKEPAAPMRKMQIA